MEIKTARRKSFDVDYVVVSEENIDQVATWCKGGVGGEGENRFVQISDKNALNVRQTKAFIGDYVLKYGNSFKCFGKKSFHKSYDDVEERFVEHARSAETGKFVSKQEAQAHPDTTVVEKVTYIQKGTGAKASLDPNEQPPSETPTENLGGLY